ncbi:class IIb bacteriocin, lactobin A/cerein 7B family [Pedobacter riviphilus]|uniref:Class IIb bacteriocin, lactobin A/cerein 7B family n=1 Tax=Pedobacter riviphilus TaxID=2766984 RepID=A0ABX6TDA3_9SPHI|nr:class IIb bacteriocin, lactobin A/cerein 7B family [Pedobacter riviphilus]QNR83468.1 class IIb bacteriocin, lactobin A/cerein 7B family [Pedobacter riviphilus]
MKIEINKFGIEELTAEEVEQVNGGFWAVLAAVAGVVYLAGEIAESAGRAYKKSL